MRAGLSAGAVLKDQIVLMRQLGGGGMGEVWLAQHRGLEASVAVKILREGATSSPEASARFEREARASARIDSPHVVRLFDVGRTDDGHPFIVMELLKGQDLKASLEEHGRLTLAAAVDIVEQICDALSSAHAARIIHRDIKPANVFLCSGGRTPFVKLLDFGVAKVAGDASLDLTATDSLLGTPYYMSPEQFVDPKAVDHRSDLWSVAVVAYATLTGRLPFAGDTIGALALATHQGEYEPPSRTVPELPPAIDAWFRRALDTDPTARFQTARELAGALASAASRPDAAALAPTIEDASVDGPARSDPRRRADLPAPPELSDAERAAAIEATSGAHVAGDQSTLRASQRAVATPLPSRGRTVIGVAAAAIAVSAAIGATWWARTREQPPQGTTATTADAANATSSVPARVSADVTATPSAPPTPIELPPPASASATVVSSADLPPSASGPAPVPARRWRRINVRCKKGATSCVKCCEPMAVQSGDPPGTWRTEPFPSCWCAVVSP